MPNNAGAVDATPTRQVLHLSYLDFNGKPRTDSYDISTSAITPADINALTAAVGAASNATLWDVAITQHYDTGVANRTDALNATDDSVKDNIVLLFKNSPVGGIDFFIPAPKSEMIVDGTENPDKTNALLAAVVAAFETVFGGYNIFAYRYSERRKKNRAVKA